MEGLEGGDEPVQPEGRDPGSDEDEAAPFSPSLPDQPGTIDDILIGRVWEFDITQGWALGALALMAIPSLMVFLPLALSAVAARRANLVVAPVYVFVSIGNAVGETWAFIWLGSAVEVTFLLLVVSHAWTWPRRAD